MRWGSGPRGLATVARMTQVVLIRPGATAYDEQNRVQGILDIPLSDRGRAEVVQLAEKISGALLGDQPGCSALYCGARRERYPHGGDRRQGGSGLR